MNEQHKPTLTEEVRFLRQLVFLQKAQIEALRTFVSAHIADIAQVPRSQTAKDLETLERAKYDEVILNLGDRYPDVAEDIDIRKILPPDEQQKWFFPEDQ